MTSFFHPRSLPLTLSRSFRGLILALRPLQRLSLKLGVPFEIQLPPYSNEMFAKMRVPYHTWALIIALTVPGKVFATYSVQPVEYYMSSGIAIPYIPGPTAQPSSNLQAPTSIASVASVPQLSTAVASTASVAQNEKVYKPSQSSASPISHTAVAVVTSALSSESAEAYVFSKSLLSI